MHFLLLSIKGNPTTPPRYPETHLERFIIQQDVSFSRHWLGTSKNLGLGFNGGLGHHFLIQLTKPFIPHCPYIYSYRFCINGWWVPFSNRRETQIFMISGVSDILKPHFVLHDHPFCLGYPSSPLRSFFDILDFQ